MSLQHITRENFEQLVLQSQKPVLLDFWATWCGPCRMIAPLVEQIAQENEAITVGKVDVDTEPELAARFGIVSIPTLVVMQEGRVTASSVGYCDKAAIEALLQA